MTIRFLFSIIFYFAIILNLSFAQNEIPEPVKSGYAPVNGLELYYEIHGNGEPLVLLHGGLGAIEMFGPNLTALAEHHKVIVVDLQAHGRTADIDRPLSLEFMADDIAALLKYLKIEKANFVGYSLGGGVALQVSVLHPELVKKQVIVSTVLRKSAFYPEILEQQKQVGPEMAEFMKQTPMYQTYASLAPRPEDWPLLLKKIGDFMKNDLDFTKNIKEVKAPTMIVAGDADLFPPSHAVEFFNLLGGGLKDGGWDGSGITKHRLAILPGVTHYNIFMKPQLIETILPFLESTKNVEVTRIINAPIEEVWKAWSEPDYVKQWWGPMNFTCPVAEMDFREGGKSLVCMKWPDEMGGTEIYSTWSYSKIIPNKSIEFIFNFSDKEGSKVKPSEIGMPDGIPDDVPHIITFKDLGYGKTEMTVSEYGYTNDQVVDLSKQGLEQSLDKMEAIFTKE